MIRFQTLEPLKPAKEKKSSKAKEANGETKPRRGRPPKKGDKAMAAPSDRMMRSYNKK